jgi:NDP-sugar pyrophosphorylase family protein
MTEDIKYGVIPVGGRGSRLKNIIGDTPKVLTKFEGIEILTYPLLSFIKVGINNILLKSSIFTHKQVKDFADEFKNRYKTFENISIEVINANKKGTAKATLFIENRVPTPFFIPMEI